MPQSRRKGISDNVQCFVEIGPRMIRGYAGAETNAVFGHSGKINRRNEKATTAQFVTQLIHSCAIANNEGHDVSRRCAGIDPDSVQMVTKIFRI